MWCTCSRRCCCTYSDNVYVELMADGLRSAHIGTHLLSPSFSQGTQCDKIKATYNGVVHLSAGDLLRAEVASGSATGVECDVMMKEGKIVPMAVTMALLRNAMISSGGSFFLIDGFPRALDQVCMLGIAGICM